MPGRNTTDPQPSAPLRGWLQASVLLGALLMAAGGLIALLHPAMLVSPRDEINSAVRVYAGYFAVRNLVLPVMLGVAIAIRARGTLNSLMLLSAFIQVMDAVLDAAESRWQILPGPAVVGLLFFIAAAKLSGHPFWRREAWTI